MSDRKPAKCAHPSCNCIVAGSDKYCSPYCEAATATTETSCGCGHAGCKRSASQAGLSGAE
jgi:hypothetical protein